MAWVKIPKEHHPLFRAAVPAGTHVVTMFGGLCGMVNGHMFGGLFGRGVFVRLAAAELAEAMALDGSEPFDPMGRGRGLRDMVVLPETIFDEPAELRAWLARGVAHTRTLPPKPTKPAAKKPAAKKPAAKRPAPKKKR